MALGALALLTCVLFASALPPDSVFYFRDVSQNHRPYRQLALEIIGSGEAPLWNPWRGAGQPLLANPNALLLHPTTLLFFLLPFEWAFKLSVILMVFVAGAGMWLLLRDRGASPPASLLGASVFAFSGYIVSLGNLINILGSAALVPLTLWLVERALRRQFAPWGSLAALSLSVQVMAGEPAILIGTGMALVALQWVGAGPGLDLGRSLGGKTAALVGVAALALALSMAGTLPSLELLARSERGAGFEPAEALKWSLSPLQLLETVIPNLFGDPTRATITRYWGGPFFDAGLPFILSLHLGAGAAVLAGLGLIRQAGGSRSQRAESMALGGALLLGLFLSLGRFAPLYPTLSFSRYPVKYFLLVSWAVSLLAARGFDAMAASADRTARARKTSSAVLLGAGVAVALLLMALAGMWLGGLPTRLPADLRATGAASVVRSALTISLVRAASIAAVVTALALLRPSPASRGALLLIPILDLLVASIPLNPVAPRSFYEEPPELSRLIPSDGRAGRIWASPRPPGFAFRTPQGERADSLEWGFRWDRMTLRNATYFPMSLRFAYDRGNERLDINPGAELGKLLYEKTGLTPQERIRLLSVAAVGNLITYGGSDLPGLVEIARLEGESNIPVVLMRNPAALPRVQVVTRAEVQPDPDLAIGRLRDPSFDPATSVILEERAETTRSDAPIGSGEAGAVSLGAEIIEETPNLLTMRAGSPSGGYLVLADTFYPGWQATVDGAETPVLRANAMFRAVAVPGGQHTVELRYRPTTVSRGAAVTALSLLLAGFLAVPRRR